MTSVAELSPTTEFLSASAKGAVSETPEKPQSYVLPLLNALTQGDYEQARSLMYEGLENDKLSFTLIGHLLDQTERYLKRETGVKPDEELSPKDALELIRLRLHIDALMAEKSVHPIQQEFCATVDQIIMAHS